MKKLAILMLSVCSGFMLQGAQESQEDRDLRLAIERSMHSPGEDEQLRKAMEISKREAEERKKAEAKTKESKEKKSAAASFASLSVEKINLHASIQEGADCAYDASKNGVLTVKWLDGTFGALAHHVFERDYLQNAHHFPLERLHKAIREHRGGTSQEFLNDGEVEDVILPILTHGFIARARIPERFTVIANVVEASENFGYIMIMDDKVNAIKRIRKDATVVHGFIINDARESGKPTGHWIAVVIHKTATVMRYYVIDSMAGYATKYPDILPSEIKALETETRIRVNALETIIKNLPVE